MKGRCFDMSAVAQLLKKPFKTPWSPPATQMIRTKEIKFTDITHISRIQFLFL